MKNSGAKSSSPSTGRVGARFFDEPRTALQVQYHRIKAFEPPGSVRCAVVRRPVPAARLFLRGLISPMRFAVIILILVLAFAASYFLKQWMHAPGDETGADGSRPGLCHRLVCMSPGITETVFALGMGDQVVGVTRYCLYPPEARQRVQVGGFLDPNFEALVALRPDLILLTPFHRELRPELERLNLPYEIIVQDTIGDIRESFLRLGALCGTEGHAQALAADFDARLADISGRIGDSPPVRVLMTTGREVRSGSLNEVYAVSSGSFLSDLLTLAGGENCVTGKIAEYPALSAEGILQLDPDVIIELGPDLQDNERETALAAWRALPGLRAVRQNRVYYLGGAQHTIPGPRILDTLEVFADFLHPDLEAQP